MTLEEFRAHRNRQPFQPFRVILKDGQSFPIFHPNLALAAEACLIIGIPAPDDPNPIYGDHTEWVRWGQVERVEPLAKPVTPSA